MSLKLPLEIFFIKLRLECEILFTLSGAEGPPLSFLGLPFRDLQIKTTKIAPVKINHLQNAIFMSLFLRYSCKLPWVEGTHESVPLTGGSDL